MQRTAERLALVAYAMALLTFSSCKSDSRPTVDASPLAADQQDLISDELHNGGTAGFLFLPPMVPRPAHLGTFVPNLPVSVRIDEIRPDGTTLRSLATFTQTSGPKREHIRVHLENARCDRDDTDGDTDPVGYYLARWFTDDAHLSTVALYRVRVFVPAKGGGLRELGFADLDVVKNEREYRSVNTREFTPLVKGKILRIKFRIDTPAVDADGDGVFDWADNCPTVANRGQADSLHNGVGDACRCLEVRCAPADACHLAGACDPATGSCSMPLAPDGTACAMPGAQGVCVAGACRPGACPQGLGDCNGDPRDGCEKSLTTVSDCGACGHACFAGPHAIAVCSAAEICGAACSPGFAECDGDAANGCEQNIATDAANCGGCGVVCTGHQTCQGGVCSTAACAAGFADCNQQTQDGCETALATDPANCGRCGNACALDHASAAACAGGRCAVAACESGWADCDGVAQNGCEASLQTDASNCGGCTKRCGPFANAVGACVAGRCSIAGCAAGFADCDASPANGCEKNLTTDIANCGGCGNTCRVPHAVPACIAGSCGIGACEPGWADCDGLPGNGCETNVAADPLNCGGCGAVCAAGANSSPVCTAGTCAIRCASGFADCDGNARTGCEIDLRGDDANCGQCGLACRFHETCRSGACSTTVCARGWADCDQDPSDGCEAELAEDALNCGACANVCSFPHAFGACTAGQCGFAVCEVGFADCDGAPANGCEVDLGNDPAHCGGCARVCPVNHDLASCAAGVCGIARCDVGFADCNGAAADGCESDLLHDLANCGGCGTACAPANATGACVAGACAIASCAPGFADCDRAAANGCEQDVAGDPNSCGGCGHVCNLPNAVAGCAAGACVIAQCAPGFADCDGNPQNGCERDIASDRFNCGGCDVQCPTQNDSVACVLGTCAIASCIPGFADCNGDIADGCEVYTAGDVANCGVCGRACTAQNGGTLCIAGSCGVAACNAGWADCDGSPYDGCETEIATDPNNCGSCGAVCVLPRASSACILSQCALIDCEPGFANCNGIGDDGCEVDTQSDVFACGGCGNLCSAPNGTASCIGGACGVAACDSGWSDCNLDPADGCETNVLMDTDNCGGCGARCNLSHATSACSGGSCAVQACDGGYGDCDADAANGCETDIYNDSLNCGACGHACVAGETCQSGTCTYACRSQAIDPITRQKCPLKTPCGVYADCGAQIAGSYWYCSPTGHVCEFLPQAAGFTAATGSCTGQLVLRQDSKAPWDKKLVPPDGIDFREGTTLAVEITNTTAGALYLDQIPLTLEMGGTNPSQFDVTSIRMYQSGSYSDYGDGSGGANLVCTSPTMPFGGSLNFTLGTGATGGCGGSAFARIAAGGTTRFIIDLAFSASETYVANRNYRLKLGALTGLKARTSTAGSAASYTGCGVPSTGISGAWIIFKNP